MGSTAILEQIVAQARREQREKEDRLRQEDAVFAAAMALSKESQRTLLIRLLDAQGVSPESKGNANGGGKAKAPEKKAADGKPTYVDLAEAFILAHPEGVSTRQVSDEIKQGINAVDGTIRQVIKRGTVERRGRFWFPVGAPVTPKPAKVKLGYREHIIAVLLAEKKPLGAGAIFAGVQKIKPDANKASVDGEIHRMKHEANPPLLIQAGVGENNGGLYALSEGATTK